MAIDDIDNFDDDDDELRARRTAFDESVVV